MKFDKRFTSGLAWAGLLVVIAVPVADFAAARFIRPEMGMAVTQPVMLPTKPAGSDAIAASTPPASAEMAPVVRAGGDPVDRFTASGKALPSYISGGEAAQDIEEADKVADDAPAAPVRVIAATGSMGEQESSGPIVTSIPRTPPVPSTEMAAIDAQAPVMSQPPLVAPVPMPASARPTPMQAAIIAGDPTVVLPDSTVVLPDIAYAEPDPKIVPPGVGLPPASIGPSYDEFVSAEELAEWESGPLSDFLAQRRGMRELPGESYGFEPNDFYPGDDPQDDVYYRY